MMRSPFSTRMRSESTTVLSRWAMAKTVRPFISLLSASCTNDCHVLAGLHVPMDAVDERRATGLAIGEVDVLELHRALQLHHHHRVRRIAQVVLRVQDVEHLVHGHQRRAEARYTLLKLCTGANMPPT